MFFPKIRTSDEVILLTQRFWNVIAGGVTILIIPYYMDSLEQGFYYTFNSLVAAQIFFELGMSYVFFQMAAHEGAGLEFEREKNQYTGDARSIIRLKDLDRKIGAVFRVSSLLYFIVVGLAGCFLFMGKLPISDWLIAWFATILGSAVSLFTTAKFALHEGLGRIFEVARARFAGSFIGHLFLWLALLGGWGLMAVPMLPLTTAAVSIIFYRAFARQIYSVRSHMPGIVREKISWIGEILPLQWRITLSWISGYFIFFIYTPMIFDQRGAVEAGQYGIAITAFSALLTLSLSWISAKLPEISKCIAREDLSTARNIFLSAQLKTLVAAVVFFVLFIAGILLLTWLGLSIGKRFPSLLVLIFMGFNLVANAYISSIAMYMRAFKEEPLLIPSITGALLQFVVLCFTLEHGLSAIAMGSALVTIFAGVPWVMMIGKSYLAREGVLRT